jgi:hypothetical protein
MSMLMTELERALRSLRLSGMIATLEARALQVARHEMDFVERSPASCRTSSTAGAPACSSGASRFQGSPSARSCSATSSSRRYSTA